MPRVAFLLSSAHGFEGRDGTALPAGYWAEQALTAYERLVGAGTEVVVLTPDGAVPVAEPLSLEPRFHQPEEDRGYFASVYRTFHRDPDDIRVTLHHWTDLDMVAARRIARRLELAGEDPAQAHARVSAAALTAWREDRSLVEVMVAEGVLPEESLLGAVAELALVTRAVADDVAGCLDELDAFGTPTALASLAEDDLDAFDALFAPGGHAAMVDLPYSHAAGRLLARLHAKQAPVATLAHGGALLLAAPDRLDGQWLFEGFRLTTATDDEEDQLLPSRTAPSWYVADALQNAGAILDDGPYPWVSHVVVDRNLITGQNHHSTTATVGALLKALGLEPPAARR